MNSVLKMILFVLSAATLVSCSSLKNSERVHNVDYKAHQQKTQDILARTADLKKYKMSKVSF